MLVFLLALLVLRVLFGALGASSALLDAFRDFLGLLGASPELSGASPGTQLASFGCPWAHLGAPEGPLGFVLRLWASHGSIWTSLWTILEPFWLPLDVPMDNFGVILGHLFLS